MAGKALKWCATHGRYIVRKTTEICPQCQMAALEAKQKLDEEAIRPTAKPDSNEFSLDNISFGSTADK